MRGTPLSAEEIAINCNLLRRPVAFVPTALQAHEDAADDTLVIKTDVNGPSYIVGDISKPVSKVIVELSDGTRHVYDHVLKTEEVTRPAVAAA